MLVQQLAAWCTHHRLVIGVEKLILAPHVMVEVQLDAVSHVTVIDVRPETPEALGWIVLPGFKLGVFLRVHHVRQTQALECSGREQRVPDPRAGCHRPRSGGPDDVRGDHRVLAVAALDSDKGGTPLPLILGF